MLTNLDVDEYFRVLVSEVDTEMVINNCKLKEVQDFWRFFASSFFLVDMQQACGCVHFLLGGGLRSEVLNFC